MQVRQGPREKRQDREHGRVSPPGPMLPEKKRGEDKLDKRSRYEKASKEGKRGKGLSGSYDAPPGERG